MSRINFKEGMFLGKEELQKFQDFQSELSESLENIWTRDSDKTTQRAFSFVFPLSPYHVRLAKVTTELGVPGILLYHNYEGNRYFVAGKYQQMDCPIGTNSEIIGTNGFCSTSSIINAGLDTVYLNLKSQESSYEDAAISITAQGQCSFVGWSRIVGSLRQGTVGRYTRIQLWTGEIYSIQSFNETTQTAQLVGESGSFETVSKVLFRFLPTLSPFSENIDDPLYTYTRSGLSIASIPNSLTVGYCEVENGEITNVVLEPQSVALPLMPQSIKTGHLQDGAVTTPKIADKSITMAKMADDVNLLGDGSVTTAKLANESVTEAKLDAKNKWRIKAGMLDWEYKGPNQGQVAPYTGIRVCSIEEAVYYDYSSINGTTIKDGDTYLWRPPTGSSLQYVNTTGESTEAGILFFCDFSGTLSIKRDHFFAKDALYGGKIYWPENVPSTISLVGEGQYYIHYRRLQWKNGADQNYDRIIIDTFTKMVEITE